MKRRLIVLFLALLLALTLVPVKAAASNSISSFSLTHNPQEGIVFILGNKQLTVTNLPDTTAFSSVMVNILNQNGSSVLKKTLKRDADGSVSLALNRLGNGCHYVELFFYVGSKIYNSYIYGDDLGFIWNKSTGAGEFIRPAALEHNIKIYENARSDSAALAYYLKQTDSIQSTSADIVKLALEITNGIAGDYSKAYAIHRWVCENIWYDWEWTTSGIGVNADAESALKNRRTICVGFSNLTAALLRASGIPAKVISGTSKTDPWTNNLLSGDVNHFWNEAYIDGRWVIIDATWDSANDYRGDMKTTSEGLYFNRYFDATIEAFSIDHYIEAYSEDSIAAAPEEPPPQVPEEPLSQALKQADPPVSWIAPGMTWFSQNAGLPWKRTRLRFNEDVI